jgi:hypothetical protein
MFHPSKLQSWPRPLLSALAAVWLRECNKRVTRGRHRGFTSVAKVSHGGVTEAVQVLQKCHMGVSQRLYKCCKSVTRGRHRCCTSVAKVSHGGVTEPVQVLQTCHMGASQRLYKCCKSVTQGVTEPVQVLQTCHSWRHRGCTSVAKMSSVASGLQEGGWVIGENAYKEVSVENFVQLKQNTFGTLATTTEPPQDNGK